MNALRTAVVVVLMGVALGATASVASASTCQNATVRPQQSTQIPAARAAVLCLVNNERTKRHLGALARNNPLQKIATSLSKTMVADQYFDHTSPSGKTFSDRLQAAHWRGSTAGENIAWGSLSLGTPAEIVNAWMHSAGHRANILHSAFRRGGVGVAIGAPESDVDDASVYSMDFDAP